MARRAGVIAALVVGVLVVPFEVYADWVVILWVAIAGLAFLCARLDPQGARAYLVVGVGTWAGAALVAFGIVAPPYRLWVGDPEYDARAAMLPAWPLSFAVLAGSLFAASRQPALARWRTWLEIGAGFTAVYLVSVGVVAVFQGMVGGPIPVEELKIQAQVALSVCWTAIGAASLVVGLVRHHPMLRHAGFALLGIATAKVFVIDLAAMDVAYRAVVLAGLGVLLLAQRLPVHALPRAAVRCRGPHRGAETGRLT